MRIGTVPAGVTAGRAPVCPRVPGELVVSALHTAGRYAGNPAGADHRRLKARLRPVRGLKRHRTARILAAGHAFVPNRRRGHCGMAPGVPRRLLRTTFDDPAIVI
jgi:transposase, IS6 family